MKRLLYLSIALVICCVAPFAQAKRAPNLEFTNLSGQTQPVDSRKPHPFWMKATCSVAFTNCSGLA
jgi:hypothetical protein